MPVQIKMNMNLSNRSRSSVAPVPPAPPSSLGSSSGGRFQNSMIDRVHFSKQGCGSCGH